MQPRTFPIALRPSSEDETVCVACPVLAKRMVMLWVFSYCLVNTKLSVKVILEPGYNMPAAVEREDTYYVLKD